MTKENRPEAAMSASDAEVRAILEARYPNDRRLQRAMIRLAELRPQGQYGSVRDEADPAFQRIVALEEGEALRSEAPIPPKAGPQAVALKAEPLVTTASAAAGRVAQTGPKAK